jgi:hypothetical protein
MIGTVSLTYTKRLNADSRLTLRAVETTKEIDRDLETDIMFSIGEPLTFDPLFPNILANQDVVEASIVVQDSTRTITYVEGLDYLLFMVGRGTELVIPPASAISSGDELSIDYEYLVNASVHYATENSSLHSSITFLKNRLSLYGRFSQTSHELISGSDNLLSLTDAQVYALGFNGSFAPVSFGGNYVDSQTTDSYVSTDGYFTFSKNWNKRRLSFTLRDIYRKFREGAKASGNTFSGRVDLHRRYPRGLTTKTAAYYRNSSGQGLDREDIGFIFDLTARFGRSAFTFEVAEEWLSFDQSRQRDDKLQIRLKRFF